MPMNAAQRVLRSLKRAPGSLSADLEGSADLAAVGRLLGSTDIDQGRAARSVHVKSRGKDHHGGVRRRCSDPRSLEHENGTI